MDPITDAIIQALSALPRDLVSSAIKDAYASLKSRIANEFGAASAVAKSVEDLEANPNSRGQATVLSQHIVEADATAHAEVMAAVIRLIEALAIAGAQTVSIGTMNVQGSEQQPVQFKSPEERAPNSSLSRAPTIVLGQHGDFAALGPAGVNRRKYVRVELLNSSTAEINNCRLDVVNLDPPKAGSSQCLLKDDISIGPKSSRFVDVACYDIGAPRAYLAITFTL